MNLRKDNLRDSAIAIAFGVTLSIVQLKFIQLYSLHQIILTRDQLYVMNDLNLKCLRRRRNGGRYSKGGVIPAEIQANKRVNDIHQFSDIDFFEFVISDKNKMYCR